MDVWIQNAYRVHECAILKNYAFLTLAAWKRQVTTSRSTASNISFQFVEIWYLVSLCFDLIMWFFEQVSSSIMALKIRLQLWTAQPPIIFSANLLCQAAVHIRNKPTLEFKAYVALNRVRNLHPQFKAQVALNERPETSTPQLAALLPLPHKACLGFPVRRVAIALQGYHFLKDLKRFACDW